MAVHNLVVTQRREDKISCLAELGVLDGQGSIAGQHGL